MSLIDKVKVKHEVVNFDGVPAVRSVAQLNVHAQNVESLTVISRADDSISILKGITANLKAKVVELIELERLEN